jgi:excisionase family DNA binding protein
MDQHRDAPQERYLTVRDVVARTKLCERTIRALIANGQLTVVRPAGVRAIRVPERAVSELMSGRR